MAGGGKRSSQIDLPPRDGPAAQLFVVLQGAGATPESMLPLAAALRLRA
jgi:hypothetical protein